MSIDITFKTKICYANVLSFEHFMTDKNVCFKAFMCPRSCPHMSHDPKIYLYKVQYELMIIKSSFRYFYKDPLGLMIIPFMIFNSHS